MTHTKTESGNCTCGMSLMFTDEPEASAEFAQHLRSLEAPESECTEHFRRGETNMAYELAGTSDQELERRSNAPKSEFISEDEFWETLGNPGRGA